MYYGGQVRLARQHINMLFSIFHKIRARFCLLFFVFIVSALVDSTDVYAHILQCWVSGTGTTLHNATLLAIRHSYDCRGAIEATLKNM